MRKLLPISLGLALFLASCGHPVKNPKPGPESSAGGTFSCYAVYPGADGAVDTKAPSGYKPFYISHYGRHGSRYVNNPDMLSEVLDILACAEKEGQLTDRGSELYGVIRDIARRTEGRIGLITPLGARELEGIGRRMAERYPSVYKGRDSIFCLVSTYQRCMLSMICYNDQIRSRYPKLKFGYDMGGEVQNVLNNAEGMDEVTKANQTDIDRHFDESFDFDGFAAGIFRDPSFFKWDAHSFVRNIFLDGADLGCMGDDPYKVFRFFTSEQQHAAWEDYNMHLYLNHCHSALTGNKRQFIQNSLVQDIIDKADRAIAGNERAADFRFGHDGAMMSLFSYIGMDGYDVCVDADEANAMWNSDLLMPMASSFHMVFYRSGNRPVLVKILFNEKETAVPALGEGPYYEWTDMKEHLLKLMDVYTEKGNMSV